MPFYELFYDITHIYGYLEGFYGPELYLDRQSNLVVKVTI